MDTLQALAAALLQSPKPVVAAVQGWVVGAGVRFDEVLSTRVFNASFEAYLSQSGANPGRAFNDLLQIRQFLTGNGIYALFDAPWAPIYIAVTFMLKPLANISGSRTSEPDSGLACSMRVSTLRKFAERSSQAMSCCTQ